MTFLAVDIGGTFTDLMAFDPGSNAIIQAKSLSTPHDLVQGILDCISKSGIALDGVAELIHGSTIAINTLIERKGARTALVVTRGTRDIYAIGRGNRPEAYNLLFHRPRALVPRQDTFEVAERMMADGSVRTPLRESDVEELCTRLNSGKYDAVAVCFLHAYANPDHEKQVGKALEQACPDAFVSLSHQILREYREYERTSTTVVNAFIGPKVGGYVDALEDRLKNVGFGGQISIMQSNGGVMAPAIAVERPVTMMESGPVGGIIAAAEIGRETGFDNVISFDMGGTTAKASLVRDGEVTMADGYYVGGYASGDPVMVPVVDVVEVGAGGGSIAWIDEVGALKVGPHSAGADPGPIAYKRGGTEPTITDANVVLGRIGASDFLGGEMQLDASGAEAGIARIAGALDLSVFEAARAIVAIAISKMSLAVRQVSVERGHDPRDFALVASGGAGPLHAAAIARELHIPTVIIPRFPGHLSALGMLLADERHDLVRTYLARLDAVDFDVLAAFCDELAEASTSLVRSEREVTRQFMLDLRYVGQDFSLSVPVGIDQIRRRDRTGIRNAFDALHDHRYAHKAPDEPIEMINVRLSVKAKRYRPTLGIHAAEHCGPVQGEREVLFDGDRPTLCKVFRREVLAPGTEIEGPALIGEYASTTVMSGGDCCRVADGGELIITVGGA